MLKDFIINKIKKELPFEPNEEKERLFDALGEFLIARDENKCFLLTGYAGTGKTSVVSALVKALDDLNQGCVLLAPTGRAAKVISKYAKKNAFTIHKYIYRQNQLGVEAFSLADNRHKNTLFIADEASMISATRDGGVFGSGSLLDDLIRYVYSGDGCALLLLGDEAQLPPVHSIESAALDADRLKGYGLEVYSYRLTQVARQALDSGILANATHIREQLTGTWDGDKEGLIRYGKDVERLDGRDFLETLERAYQEVGQEETLIITRSNKRTNLFNQGVRTRVLYKEDVLNAGDRIMVSKNNYFVAQEYKEIAFLANGDMFDVIRVRKEHEMYGFRFAQVTLRSEEMGEKGKGEWEIETMVWLDTLLTDSPEQNYGMQQELFSRIAEDYPEIRNKKEMIKAVYASPYYNALQVRFAYAVTCHKSQGGQWKRVFLDLPLVGTTNSTSLSSTQMNDKEYLRWLYTAITRSTEYIYIIQ